MEAASWYETYIALVGKNEMVGATDLMEEDVTRTVIARMDPYWAPDGQSLLIAYTYERPTFLLEEPDDDSGFQEVGFVTLNLGTLERNRTREIPPPLWFWEERIAWSPLNDLLVWHSSQGWKFATLTGATFRYEPDKLEIPYAGCWPIWSPAGDTFAFTETATPTSCGGDQKERGIFVVTPATGNIVEVTQSLGGDNLLLAWIPDHQ
jgi:Tol biopolymer transport system component